MTRTAAVILSLFLLAALAGGLLALAQAGGDPPTELYVRTVPAGAKVFIDGKEVGVSDDLFEVKPGTRKVKVELSGYEPAVKEAIVPESRIERVVFELEKPEGSKVSEPGSASKKMIALVEDFFHHNFRDITDRETIEWGEVEQHENGHKSIRYKYLATIWGKKKQLMNQRFTFDSDGKFAKYENVVEVPRPVKIVPAPGARDVDPDLKEIRITFDRDMEPGEFRWWSWFPGHCPYGAPEGKWVDSRTYVLPVALKKAKAYCAAFNWEGGAQVRSVQGVPAPPTQLYFCTEGASPETLALLKPPKVTKFSIANGSENVPPGETKLSVTFDQPLGTGVWRESSGTLAVFGDPLAQPFGRDNWSEDKRTFSVRAKLEPGRRYTIHLNEGGLDTVSGRRFENTLGLALAPTTWEFSTAGEKPETEDSAAKENLLANPGAESGDKTPDGWEQGASIPGVTYSWDKNVAHTGKASLCIEKTADRYFPIAEWSSRIVERTGDATTMELSAYFKAEKMTKAVLDVLFVDEDGEWVSHEWVAYIGAKTSGDPPADHDWKKYSGFIKIPPRAAKYRVRLQVYGPGKVWFDDVVLKEVDEDDLAASGTDFALSGVSVDITIPATNISVGDTVRCEVLLNNHGKESVKNVHVTLKPDANLTMLNATPGFKFSAAADGPLSWDMATMDPGKTARWELETRATAATDRASFKVVVWTDEGHAIFGEKCLRIVESADGKPAEPLTHLALIVGGSSDRLIKLVEGFFAHNPADVTDRETIEWGGGGGDSNGNRWIRYMYLATISGKRQLMNEVFTFDADGKYVKHENVKGFPKDVTNGDCPEAEPTVKSDGRSASEKRPNPPAAPRPVKITPEIAATDVEANLQEIRVTFDRDMDTGGMSWCGAGEHFPEIDGEATWIDKRTCALPVKLEEGKAYRLALNWEKYRNFQSAEGVPVIPTAVYFCTKGAGPELIAQMTPPKVVSLSIENGAKDVPPGRTKLSGSRSRLQPCRSDGAWRFCRWAAMDSRRKEKKLRHCFLQVAMAVHIRSW